MRRVELSSDATYRRESALSRARVMGEIGLHRGDRGQLPSAGVLIGDFERFVVEHVREPNERRFDAGDPQPAHRADHQRTGIGRRDHQDLITTQRAASRHNDAVVL